MKTFRNAAKRSSRRAYPIMGYVGPNGAGKSAAMVWDTLPSLEAGRPVLGTVRLLDYENPRDCEDQLCAADPFSGHYVRALPDPETVRTALTVGELAGEDPVAVLNELGDVVGVHGAAHPLWIPLTDWQQVLDARGLDLLLDEVTGVASSRESASLPAAIANTLVQLRRKDVTVRFSSPAWARADKILRETAVAVTWCRGYMPKRERSEAGADRLWSHKRLFRWKTYDATLFEDFTSGKREELGTLVADWHWGPGSPAFAAYDTYDGVLALGAVTDAGTCYRCQGTRRRQECRCPDYVARKSSAARGPRLRGGAVSTDGHEHGQEDPAGTDAPTRKVEAGSVPLG